jgi:multidrug efflux pump subunit AcrB
MRLNISAWSIRKPIPSIVLFLVLVALGLMSFRQLPVTRLPNVDLPIVSVAVPQFGAGAGRDRDAGDQGRRERRRRASPGCGTSRPRSPTGCRRPRSTSGSRPTRRLAVNEVKDAVARCRSDLPRTVQEPVIQRIEVAGLPILIYGVVAPSKTPEEISWFVDDTVKRALLGLRGVANVERVGGRRARDPGRARSGQARRRRRHGERRQPAASKRQRRRGGLAAPWWRGARRRSARWPGARTVEALGATPIQLATGGTIRLDDLGAVRDGVAEPRTFARSGDDPVVAFSVSRAKGASDVSVSRDVAAKVAEIEAANPPSTSPCSTRRSTTRSATTTPR